MTRLADHFVASLLPLLRLKPAFEYPDGIFSPLQRARLLDAKSIEYARGILRGRFPLWGKSTESLPQAQTPPLTPVGLLTGFAEKLESDIGFLSGDFITKGHPCEIEGPANRVYIHKTAQISSMAVIDTREGAVVIDKQAQVSAFSLLKGPLYIGAGCRIDRASISNSRVGLGCRLGGEISDSFFGDFSNKHHEGFVGHSFIGDWVNLGALTTTSDLKNNYGEVRLQYRHVIEPTGVIKFGSIIGDYAKTAIGTLLNTGTIVDFGCLLFENRPSLKYYPPFFWGGPQAEVYHIGRFLSDSEKIMTRRNQSLTQEVRQAIQLVYDAELQRNA